MFGHQKIILKKWRRESAIVHGVIVFVKKLIFIWHSYIIHIIRHSILTFYQAFFLVSIARVRARACPNWAGAPDRDRVRRSPDYRGACERSPVCQTAVELAVSFWSKFASPLVGTCCEIWVRWCPQCKAREWEAAKAWAAEGRSYTF